jgi:hypothetical protein
MADYSFGGTEEENAELKKLNAEVVCVAHSQFENKLISYSPKSLRIQTASRTGKSLSELQNPLKAA